MFGQGRLYVDIQVRVKPRGCLFLRECKVTGTVAVFSVTRSEALTLLCPPLPGDLANVSCQWPGPSIINAPNSAASWRVSQIISPAVPVRILPASSQLFRDVAVLNGNYGVSHNFMVVGGVLYPSPIVTRMNFVLLLLLLILAFGLMYETRPWACRNVFLQSWQAPC